MTTMMRQFWSREKRQSLADTGAGIGSLSDIGLELVALCSLGVILWLGREV